MTSLLGVLGPVRLHPTAQLPTSLSYFSMLGNADQITMSELRGSIFVSTGTTWVWRPEWPQAHPFVESKGWHSLGADDAGGVLKLRSAEGEHVEFRPDAEPVMFAIGRRPSEPNRQSGDEGEYMIVYVPVPSAAPPILPDWGL